MKLNLLLLVSLLLSSNISALSNTANKTSSTQEEQLTSNKLHEYYDQVYEYELDCPEILKVLGSFKPVCSTLLEDYLSDSNPLKCAAEKMDDDFLKTQCNSDSCLHQVCTIFFLPLYVYVYEPPSFLIFLSLEIIIVVFMFITYERNRY